MAEVNAASAAAFGSSVVHDVPVSGWRNEGIPWLRGAAARRFVHNVRSRGHTAVTGTRVFKLVAVCPARRTYRRRKRVNSWLAAAMPLRAAASYGLQRISRMEARRRLAVDCTAGVNQFFLDARDNRAPTQRRHCAASQNVHYCRGYPVNPVLVTRLRSLEIERGMRTGPHGKLIRIPLF